MIEEQLVVALDGGRARFFRVGLRARARETQKKQLTEIETLINPTHRAKDSELWSDSRPGLRSSPTGTSGHAVDDKRNAHSVELDRKFAKLVIEKMATLIRDKDIAFAIVAAGPAMLGHLRDYRQLLPRIEIGELPKQLTDLSAHELCLRLESEELI